MNIIRAYDMDTLLQAVAQGARPAGGFTDLMAARSEGKRIPEFLVDVTGVPELKEIASNGQEVRLGAALTLSEAEKYLASLPEFKALYMAVRSMAGPQVRNVATLAGNIASASPAADTVPALIALGAELELRSAEDLRRISVEDFMYGPGTTLLEPGEIIESICLPEQPGVSEYTKVGRRNAMAICVAGLAVYMEVSDERISNVRLVAAAAGPKAVRLKAAEALLEGIEPDPRPVLIEQVKAAVLEDISPIDDGRATAGYRSLVLQNLVADAVTRLCCSEGVLERSE